MPTSEAIFKREFAEMIRGRHALTLRSGSHSFSVDRLPIPAQPVLPKGRVCLVRGSQERFFKRLNNTQVELVGRTVLQKRQVLSDGTFRRDDKGHYVTDQVPVPRESVAVVSGLSIGLKRFVVENGVKRQWKVSKGYRYVDYVEHKGRRWYIYILPKKHVYRLNMTALIVSSNKHRSYYHGARLSMQNGMHLFMYIIPYTYRTTRDSRVLLVKSGLDFTREVQGLLQYWQSLGVIFDLQICQLNEDENLCLKVLDPKIGTDDYRLYEQSLAEESQDGFDDCWRDGEGEEFGATSEKSDTVAKADKRQQRRGDNGKFR